MTEIQDFSDVFGRLLQMDLDAAERAAIRMASEVADPDMLANFKYGERRKIFKATHVIPYEGDTVISLHRSYSGAWQAAKNYVEGCYRPYLTTIVGQGGDVVTGIRLSEVSQYLRHGLTVHKPADFIIVEEVDILP